MSRNLEAFTNAAVACREVGHAVFGIDLPVESDPQSDLADLVEHVGVVSTRDGGASVWPVAPREKFGTFSVRTGNADLHTDAQYHDNPESFVFLYAQRPACDGGDSLLLHMDDLVGELQRNPVTAPHLGELFRPVWSWRTPTVFGGEASTLHPVLTEETIRWRSDNLVLAHDSSDLAFVAGAVSAVTRQSAATRRVRLDRGMALLVDNARVLHGRTNFADHSRVLFRTRFWKLHI